MKNINTKEYWDKVWSQDGIISFRYYPLTYEYIINKIGSKKKVLELGFGNGILLNELHKKGNVCVGIDISEFACEKVKIMYGLDVYNMQVPPIPIIDKEFDFCVATEFLEHFNNVDEIVSEMSRVAYNIIIAVPDDCLGHEDLEEHYQKFNKKSLKELLEKYFDNVEVIAGDNLDNYKGIIGFASNKRK